MVEKDISEADLKQYDPILQDKVRTGMYKELLVTMLIMQQALRKQ